MKFDLTDLNKLRSFAAVFETGSIHAAARAMRLTPSAVSVSLKNLEKDLGTPLFSRLGKRFVPTAEAVELYQVSERFATELAHVVGRIHHARERISGTVKIGVPVGFGTKVLIPMAAEFRTAHEDVQFVFRFGGPSQIWSQLDGGEIDVMMCGALERLPCDGVYEQRLIGQAALHLICSSQFQQNHLDRGISLATLERCPHVLITETRGHLEKWYEDHYKRVPRLQTPLEVDSVFAAIEAVRRHSGLALVPVQLVEQELAGGELVTVLGPRGSVAFRYYAFRRVDRVVSPAAQAFVDFACDRLAPERSEVSSRTDLVYDRFH